MDRNPLGPASQFSKDGKPETPSRFALPLRGLPAIFPSPQNMIDDARPLRRDLRANATGAARSGSQPERNMLPSIRQAIPEINSRLGHMGPAGHQIESSMRPTGGLASAPPGTPREYPPLSPGNKRRKISNVGDGEPDPGGFAFSRERQSPPRYGVLPQTADGASGTQHPAFPVDEWPGSAHRPSSHSSSRPLVHMPPRTEASMGIEFHPTLSRVPSMAHEAGYLSERRESAPNYTADPRFSVAGYTQHSPTAPMAAYQAPNFAPYNYEQPRSHSYSGPSPYHPHVSDRSPFSPTNGIQAEIPPHAHAMAGIGAEGSRQGRKRRGNLPKETTDKLRDWFKRHLTHPYPTEDEKQDLMRQTGLQMNQISNWFINARRRQLPAMINSARAEETARSLRARNTPRANADDRYDAEGRSVSYSESDTEGDDERAVSRGDGSASRVPFGRIGDLVNDGAEYQVTLRERR